MNPAINDARDNEAASVRSQPQICSPCGPSMLSFRQKAAEVVMRWVTAVNESETRVALPFGVSEDVDDGFKSVHHLITFFCQPASVDNSHQTFSRAPIVVWGWTWLACNSHGILFEKTSARIFPWMAEGMPVQSIPRTPLHPPFMRLSTPF